MVSTTDEILHGSVIAEHEKVQSSRLFSKKQPQPSAASGFVDAGADVADSNCRVAIRVGPGACGQHHGGLDLLASRDRKPVHRLAKLLGEADLNHDAGASIDGHACVGRP